MAEVSARLSDLRTFVANSRVSADSLAQTVAPRQSAFRAFSGGAGSRVAAAGDAAMGAHVDNVVSELREMADFVELVADALERSDAYDGGDSITVDAVLVDSLMRERAAVTGKSYGDLVQVGEPVTVDLPQVGTVPADSGWVADPVATATGHFVAIERDFPMPARLGVLEWERTYASTAAGADAGLGGGWFSWLDARAVRVGTAVVVTDQRGRVVELGPDPHADEDQRYRSADGNVTASALPDGSVAVTWGRRTEHAYQCWTFNTSGHLTTVAGEQLGTTGFEYGDGRLSRLVHDGGRELALHWAGPHLWRIDASDGRAARYVHSDGTLTAVDAPGSKQRYVYDPGGRIRSVIDADEVTLVEVSYDADGRAIEQRENTGGVTRFEYGATRRTFVGDADGNRRAGYLHDAEGRVILATGSPLQPLSRRFDTEGRTVHQVNPDGSRFSMTVAAGDLPGTVEIIHHDHGSSEVFEYDRADRLVRYSCDGRRLDYSYQGESGLPSRVVAHDGWTVDLEWRRGQLLAAIDADGIRSGFEYDCDGNLTLAVDGAGNCTAYEYHPSGVRQRTTHPDGAVESVALDDAGRMLAFVDGVGGEIRCDLSPGARLRSITDPTGAAVRIEYDESGCATEIIDAGGNRCGWHTDDDGRPHLITLPDGSTRRFECDLAGRLVGVSATEVTPTGPVERDWAIERSPNGTTTGITSPGGRTTRFSHVSGQVAESVTSVGDDQHSWRYDRSLDEQVVTDESGATWTSTSDETGRVISCLASDGEVTTYRYTPAGRLSSVDGARRSISFDYDARGMIIGRNEGQGTWRFDRDVRGRVIAVESPMGRRQTFAYDASGRLVTKTLGTAVTRHAYDGCGRLIATIHPSGDTTTYHYGAMGELREVRDRAGGVTTYEYDSRGRLVVTTDPAGGVTRQSYAFDHRPAAVVDAAGRQRSFGYDLDGLLTSVTDGEGVTTLARDGRGRIVAREYVGAGRLSVEPDVIRCEYDPVGRLVAIVQGGVRTDVAWPNDGPVAPMASSPTEVTLDLDGLGLAVRTDGFERVIRRDEVGRRIEVVDSTDSHELVRRLVRNEIGDVVATEVGGRRSDFDFHPSGFLAGSTSRGELSAWTYDDLGRMSVETTAHGRRSFHYDDAHQLVEVVDAGRSTMFDYDERGRRVRAAGAFAAEYEWDDVGLTAIVTSRGRTEFARDVFGFVTTITSSIGATTEIQWDRASSLPKPITIGASSVITDGASVAAMRDADGRVTPLSVLVGPWGEVDHDPGVVGWHPFHGLHVDGIVVLGARVYDVATRQFLSPDPRRSIVGMASSGWTYCYAANDPVKLLDPLGLSPLSADEFERITDRYTSTQWGNIAQVAIVVAAIALTPTGAGPLVLVAAGAATGFAAEGGRQLVDNVTNTGDQGYDPGAIFKSTVVGAVSGVVRIPVAGEGSSPFVQKFGIEQGSRWTATVSGRAGVNAVDGFAGGVVSETYDVAGTIWSGRLPGSDGSFDVRNVMTDMGMSVVTGELAEQVWPSAPDLPTARPEPDVTTAPGGTEDIAVADIGTGPTRGTLPRGDWVRESGGQTSRGCTPERGTIKLNRDSMIYHTQDSPYYEHTIADGWATTPAEAAAREYRAPRR